MNWSALSQLSKPLIEILVGQPGAGGSTETSAVEAPAEITVITAPRNRVINLRFICRGPVNGSGAYQVGDYRSEQSDEPVGSLQNGTDLSFDPPAIPVFLYRASRLGVKLRCNSNVYQHRRLRGRAVA